MQEIAPDCPQVVMAGFACSPINDLVLISVFNGRDL